MNIVVAEDNGALNFAIKLLLESNGHRVTAFESADALIDAIGQQPVDLFVLDINLPDMDGFELLGALKPSFADSDFIFISSYTDIRRISKAFNLGCEDYLKKPFEIEELLLRVKKIESRRTPGGTLTIGTEGYTYDFDKKMLYFRDAPQLLTKKESEVLDLLARNHDRIVTYEMLAEYVWEASVPRNNIAAVVRRLRKKLAHDLIESIREEGYVLTH